MSPPEIDSRVHASSAVSISMANLEGEAGRIACGGLQVAASSCGRRIEWGQTWIAGSATVEGWVFDTLVTGLDISRLREVCVILVVLNLAEYASQSSTACAGTLANRKLVPH
eukprot:3805112-Rhodomonas_salina.2